MGLWHDSFWVWKIELTVRSSILPLLFLSFLSVFPPSPCLWRLPSWVEWPLALGHRSHVCSEGFDWIMPVFMKWGEETFAKSWPWGTLFLCGLIWAMPAKHRAKKDSWKYFLCISLLKDWYLVSLVFI